VNILICNFEYPPLGGGGGIATASLAKALADRHRVTVLTSGVAGTVEQKQEDRVHVIRVPVLGRRRSTTATLLSMASYLVSGSYVGVRALRSQSYDIVNSHFVLPTGIVGDFIAHRAGKPHVVSVHGGDLYDPSKWLSPHAHATLRWTIRRLVRRASLVVGQSTNTIDNLARFYSCTTPVERIPLGIPAHAVPSPARARFRIDASASVLITVCRLVRRKGLEQLLQLLQRLEDLDCVLIVVGTGPQKQELEELAARLGVAERIRFLGWVSEDDKFAALASADVFVSTSQHEGFGLMYLEAMACGLPVVTYDNGGQTDFLRDGETGGVIPVNDLAAFEGSLRRLLADEALRAGVSRTNRQKFETLTIDRCARLYETAFENVLRQPAKQRATMDQSS
jgi:glycosyltransferase involved in cell wall biosynthesis